MKTKKRTIGIVAGVLAVSSLLGLVVTGYEIGWGSVWETVQRL